VNGTLSLDERITRRVQGVEYRAWRETVEAVNGCLHPVRLSGSWTVQNAASGAVLASKSGHIFAPCGNRRAAVCPSCSDRYAADAFHVVHVGVAGGRKGVPAAVAERPRVFATLTAPSFGPVHNRRTSTRGKTLPCRCGAWHHPADPRIGAPVDPDGYDYIGAVLWQAHVGQLWHRFRIALRRKLAQAAGIRVRDFADHARIEYGKVAEYQRRGLVHFHAVVRVDGPAGPDSPAPRWATTDMLSVAIRAAAHAVTLNVGRPDGTLLPLGWGEQVDVRHISPTTADQVEDADGQISEQRLASYVAKYATKGTGKSEAADRPIRSQRHLDRLDVGPHHLRIIQTAWDLGGRPEYAELNLRKWAHMLGFRGHFLTKSKRYSVTFRAVRAEQREYRAAQALDRLGVTPDQVVVINDWRFGGIGYLDEAERELAHGIAQRLQQQTSTGRREAA
jgi:hypothetical protein